MFWVPVLLTLLVVFVSLYATYYLVRVVSPPKIITSNKTMRLFLEEHCPVLYQTYWPTFWALQAHVHTISRVVIQSWPSIKMTRETVRLSDDGHVCLDWCNETDSVDDSESCRPTVIILPGLSGHSGENYISHFLNDMLECNYRSVVFNYRGCGDTGLSTPKLYCAGNVGDLSEAICHIKKRFPKSPLIAAGTSLGGKIVEGDMKMTFTEYKIICYLNECYKLQKDPQLIAALTISVPWNLHTTSSKIHQPVSRFTINAYLSYKIRKIIKGNQDVFSRNQLPFDYRRVMKCYFFRDLEQHLSCPMFEFKDLIALRDHGSPHSKVDGIRIPLLCLNSEDDPFCPINAIPEDDILKNQHITLALTSKGGHVAFMQGASPFGKNLMDHTLIQFTKAMFNHRHELQQSSL